MSERLLNKTRKGRAKRRRFQASKHYATHALMVFYSVLSLSDIDNNLHVYPILNNPMFYKTFKSITLFHKPTYVQTLNYI